MLGIDIFRSAKKAAVDKPRLAGQKPPLKLKEIWAIRVHLQLSRRHRDLALFNLAIDSKHACMRPREAACPGCLSIGPGSDARHHHAAEDQAAGAVEITEQTRAALSTWIHHKGLGGSDPLFPSRIKTSPHLSTRQYARMLKSWLAQIGLEPEVYGTHSLRRTKATLIYRRTKNLRAVQLLLGHTKLESTVRYLGIEVDDALEIAEKTDI